MTETRPEPAWNPRTKRAAGAAVVGGLAILHCACGGGPSAPPAAATPGNGGTNDWTPGVFLPSDSFAAECANPRAGIDPDTGQPYPDVAGRVVDENNWLRSWSNELYLWYDEIPELNPANYATPAYFAEMKTDATTSSGAPKDRFHDAVPTEQWRQLSQSGISAGYGAQFSIVSGTPPRRVVVAYTEPNSPATSGPVQLTRGAEILTVDGADLVNATDAASLATINDGLFPAGPGETHVLTFRPAGGGPARSLTLVSADVASDPVRFVDTVDTLSGKVGYMLFNSHIETAEDELIDAIRTLDAEDVIDLVLDLRYNGGGLLAISSQLAYMIAGPVATAGRTFELLEFNDKHPSTNPVTGSPLSPLPFLDVSVGFGATSGVRLPTLDLARVFVLTGPNTCSASESVINSLRGVGVEVIQIGSTTCGKPYGFYPADNCGTTYFSIQFRGVNHQGFGDYTDGFSPANSLSPSATTLPGCSVADDYDSPLGDPGEGRFEAALAYMEGNGCPSPSGLAPPAPVSKLNGLQSADDSTAPAMPTDGRLMRPQWLESKIP